MKKVIILDFDLRTANSAYNFVLSILKTNSESFIKDYLINCERDFETLWRKHCNEISTIDVKQIRIFAFHVCGSLDNCQTIQQIGLQNLQIMLSSDSLMYRVFESHGLTFNIKDKIMIYQGQEYNVDYELYRNHHFLNDTDEHIQSIACRIYCDFCVNGFMCNDNIFTYGTNIHKRPEFICDLVRMFPELSRMEDEWERNMISYRVDFYAYFEQLHRFNFELDNYREPPYDEWHNLDDNTKVLKWMLSHAIDRSFNELGETYLYVKDNYSIPPEQIVNYTIIQDT